MVIMIERSFRIRGKKGKKIRREGVGITPTPFIFGLKESHKTRGEAWPSHEGLRARALRSASGKRGFLLWVVVCQVVI